MSPLTPFEIVKRTPKTNCRQCGYQTCLAFGAAVATRGENLGKCPFVKRNGLDLSEAKVLGDNLQRDLELIRHLKEKIAGLNFSWLAGSLGCSIALHPEETLAFRYLGQNVVLSRKGIFLDGREPEDPRDQILLYNYLFFGGDEKIKTEWIGMESMPNSFSKIKTLEAYAEKPLAEFFQRTPKEKSEQIVQSLDGYTMPAASACFSCVIPVLPKLPQQILFWQAEPEEGFAAKVKILFDASAPAYLDLESLVFSSERMADRFAALMPPIDS